MNFEQLCLICDDCQEEEGMLALLFSLWLATPHPARGCLPSYRAAARISIKFQWELLIFLHPTPSTSISCVDLKFLEKNGLLRLSIVNLWNLLKIYIWQEVWGTQGPDF